MTATARPGTVHVVVPDAIDDPLRASGGNRYDRRVCDGLAARGWQVHEHAVPDAWPRLGPAGTRATARLVAGLPDGALVLADGLIASAAAQVLVPAAARLLLVPLVHLPLGDDAAGRAAESRVLAAARAVVATSGWTRDLLVTRYALPAQAVRVAEPGVDPAPPAVGSEDGTHLLSVGAVAPHKAQDVLVAALAALGGHRWCCRCVGALDRDRAFVAGVRDAARRSGIDDRFHVPGPLRGRALDAAFRWADVLVHPARVESYGMVVTEALARGVPVIAAASGGLPDALGHTPDGTRPGILVPAGDAGALEVALRRWLTDAALRRRLREAAAARRASLPTWADTAARVAQVLTAAAG